MVGLLILNFSANILQMKKPAFTETSVTTGFVVTMAGFKPATS